LQNQPNGFNIKPHNESASDEMRPILIVDDEENIVNLVRLYLTNEGYQVESARTGKEALDAVKKYNPQLVILDLMLPEMSGWDVCREIRKTSSLPILMLTARDADVDKIVGLELGADDYLTKPFNPRELVARVKAILRRSEAKIEEEKIIVSGDLKINLESREVMVKEKRIDLRPKEFDLLKTLAQHPHRVFNREKLLELVWGYDFYGDSRTVDVHIQHLRNKLDEAGLEPLIQTVWGVGYKFEASPDET